MGGGAWGYRGCWKHKMDNTFIHTMEVIIVGIVVIVAEINNDCNNCNNRDNCVFYRLPVFAAYIPKNTLDS